MMTAPAPTVHCRRYTLDSSFLGRPVVFDVYSTVDPALMQSASLLLVNDGQDLEQMHFPELLARLLTVTELRPLLCVGIHCGDERVQEYGMIHSADYKGRGSKAPQYRSFLLEELIPFLESKMHSGSFSEVAVAGFSLGGLTAFDLAWNHPEIFTKAGIFSGSFWWRSVDKTHKTYSESGSRLMHVQVHNGSFKKGLKFFFECGDGDEEEDRNHNGVIDSIDDTIDLMRELLAKGYQEGGDFHYEQVAGGRHDIATWALAFPAFLRWGWAV